MSTQGYRTHASPGRGGLGIDPRKTAALFIEFQNEFTTPGGKLHPQVKENMDSTGMLANASQLAKDLRALGVKVFHAPISFAEDGSDNPNRYLGILGGCDNDKLFTRGTWNAEICNAMTPQPEDILVKGKRGLSAFPNTNLEESLKAHNIETIALGGFMANCCVESTMREACEKGFNLVTLTDCVATTSSAGYKAAVEITYPFFSTPMNAASFLANVKAAVCLYKSPSNSSAKRPRLDKPQHKTFAFDRIADDVFQAGPWFVDVRQGVQGDRVVVRSGEHELRRYLTFGEASGMMGRGIPAMCDCIYFKKMPEPGKSTEPFGWMCNMTVVRLPAPEGGCVLYSPVLGPCGTIDEVVAALTEHSLLPVRIILSPTPQHHLALSAYQQAFPDAFYICGKASGQMPPLTRKRRDLRFDGVISSSCSDEAVLSAPVVDREGSDPASDTRQADMWQLLQSVFHICVLDDNRTGEITLFHKLSKTLIISDLLYKSNPDIVGPGGKFTHYATPGWFAEGQEELFYGHPQDNSGGLLPSYRTHPRMRSIDIPGMRRSLDKLLAFQFQRVLACHTDPIEGAEARGLIKRAWAWVWDSV